MSRVDAAGPDRLPWLPDEPAPKKPFEWRGRVAGFAAAAILLVAAGGFYLGVESVRELPHPLVKQALPQQTAPRPDLHAPPSPQLHLAQPSEVRPMAQPQVRPAPAREVRIAAPPVQKTPDHKRGARTGSSAEEQTTVLPEAQLQAVPDVPAIAPPAIQYSPAKPWPPRLVRGAGGRLVQIGAFGTRHQAKRGWWFMVGAYPAVAHLPAVVTETRNSRGRAFYRFQVGTTSQAHSEILCQRMRMIRLSCAVVGLPWKAKVER